MEGQGAGRPLEMGAENELQLADYLFVSARCKYGLCHQDILELAGEFIREEKIKTRWINGIPGQDWLKNFLKRHPRVVAHKDEVLSSKLTNSLDVCDFHRDLDRLYQEESMTADDAHRLYSLLEISLPCEDQSKDVDTLQDHDILKASVLTCICADGGRLPPLVVFQGDCVSCARNRNETPNKCSDGDILFCYWFENFFIPTLPKSANSTILFLEGQSFRVNLRVLKLARRNNVIFLKFPPKLATVFQPLDSKYSFDLKSVYDIQFQKESKRHKIFDDKHREKFGSVVGSIWEKSVNMNSIVKGFERTGIFPLDTSKFDENEFLEPSLKRFKEAEEIDATRNINDRNNVLNPLLSESANSNFVQVLKISHVTSVATIGLNDTDEFTAASKEGSSSYPSVENSEAVMSEEISQKEEKGSLAGEFQRNGKEFIEKQVQNHEKDPTHEHDDKDFRHENDDKDAKQQENGKNLSHKDVAKDSRHEYDKQAMDQADEKDTRDHDDDRDTKHEGGEKDTRHEDNDKDARHLNAEVENVPKTAVIGKRRRSERIFKKDFSGKVKISVTRKTI
ncbi:hypothetical protein JTE90_014676 [Oedothorax gibbosus]|uniref:DDE-1 domain-containing protein n=1 Tax=Oedothorax gibbosus TaxID=931172 RepID=A0AAV6UHP8_9ARAC|nr:hypothetical protein JTE90_014676 [Oedothorax gibbosus]